MCDTIAAVVVAVADSVGFVVDKVSDQACQGRLFAAVVVQFHLVVVAIACGRHACDRYCQREVSAVQS